MQSLVCKVKTHITNITEITHVGDIVVISSLSLNQCQPECVADVPDIRKVRELLLFGPLKILK